MDFSLETPEGEQPHQDFDPILIRFISDVSMNPEPLYNKSALFQTSEL